MLLDEAYGAVGTGGDGLHAGAGKPEDDAAAEDEAEDGVGVEQIEHALGGDAQGLLYHEDEGEDHGGGAGDGGTDQHGLGCGLEGVAGAIVGLKIVLGLLKVGGEVKLVLDLLLGLLDIVLDEGELVDALGIVGDGTVAVDGDGDGAHAEHAEGDEAEGEDAVVGAEDGGHAKVIAGEVGDDHQEEEDEAGPEAAVVAGDESGEDIERRSALARGLDDFTYVGRIGRGEDLGELGDEGGAEGAAADDDGEAEPVAVTQLAEDEVAGDEGADDGEQRGDPDEGGEGLLKVEVVDVAVLGLGQALVDIVGGDGGDDSQDTHAEDPDEEAGLILGGHGEQDEGDEGDAGHSVGLKSVGRGAYAVARIVARAVCDDTRIARIVLADAEDDLHQVRTDVRNLGEDTAGNTQRGGAEGLTDGKTDEAAPGQMGRHKEQDDEHEQELDADEYDADAHAGGEGDIEQEEGTAPERRKGHTRIGVGIHADAVPGDAVGAEYADDGPAQDEADGAPAGMLEQTKVEEHGGADEEKEDAEKLALLPEVSGAGLEYDVADGAHLMMGRQSLDMDVLPKTEDQAQQHDGKSPIEDVGLRRRGKTVGHLEVSLARAHGQRGCQAGKGQKEFSHNCFVDVLYR